MSWDVMADSSDTTPLLGDTIKGTLCRITYTSRDSRSYTSPNVYVTNTQPVRWSFNAKISQILLQPQINIWLFQSVTYHPLRNTITPNFH